jgi:NitT/TauT family transport system substrate-binding protein
MKAWLRAHVEITERLKARPKEALTDLNVELARLTGKALPVTILEEAFSNLTVSVDPIVSTFFKMRDDAFTQGFLGHEKPEIKGLFDLEILNSILAEKNLKTLRY